MFFLRCLVFPAGEDGVGDCRRKDKSLNFEELKVGEAKQNKAAANAELCRASCEVAALMQLGRMAPRFLQMSV